MKLYPKAKINLGLNVVEHRPDGYHNIETVFYPIGIVDELEVVNIETAGDKPSIELTLEGNKIEGALDDNLVVKAYNLLNHHYKLSSCRTTLKKRIPSQAGMGGGSSDAASMLHAINVLNNLNLTEIQLQQYASMLGADCAFFVNSKPVYAEGIGTDFSDVDISDEIIGKWLVVVKPPVAVSTRIAYQGVAPRRPNICCRDVVCRPLSEWRKLLINDFETSVFRHEPMIGNIKQFLYDEGAIFSQMSGSGSAVYGIFKTEPNHISQELFPDCFTFIQRIEKI